MIYYLYHHWIGGKKEQPWKSLRSWVQLPPGPFFCYEETTVFHDAHIYILSSDNSRSISSNSGPTSAPLRLSR